MILCGRLYSPKGMGGWASGVRDAEGGGRREAVAFVPVWSSWGLIEWGSRTFQVLAGLLAVFTGLMTKTFEHSSHFSLQQNLWGEPDWASSWALGVTLAQLKGGSSAFLGL